MDLILYDTLENFLVGTVIYTFILLYSNAYLLYLVLYVILCVYFSFFDVGVLRYINDPMHIYTYIFVYLSRSSCEGLDYYQWSRVSPPFTRFVIYP